MKIHTGKQYLPLRIKYEAPKVRLKRLLGLIVYSKGQLVYLTFLKITAESLNSYIKGHAIVNFSSML